MAESVVESVPDQVVVGGPWVESRGPGLGAAKALLAGICLMMVGNGLQGAVLGVRADSEGFGLTVAGLVMACYFLGFFFGTSAAVNLLTRVGHIRTFAAFASTASSAALLYVVWVNPISWGVLRVVFGLCMAGTYVVVESWLNDMATNENRGRLLAMYMVVMMGGASVGQFLLNAADPNGFRLFILSSVLISMALIPVTLSATSAPPLAVPEPLSLRELFQLAPAGLVTSFWVGTAHGTLVGLGALFAANEGLTAARIAWFIGVPALGAVVFQWPIGALSDRVSRRAVMFFVAIAAAVVSGALIVIEPGAELSFVFMFMLGGCTFPLYSLAMAITNDRVPPAQLNSASAGLVRTSGFGLVLGPALGGAVMAATAADAYFVILVVVHAIIAAYLAYRIVATDAIPVEQQSRFAQWPARASAMAVHLIKRPLRR